MEIEFHASIATGKNAITVDGNGDGAEIKFCIPRSEMRAILGLQLMTEKLLTIKVIADEEESDKTEIKTKGKKANGSSQKRVVDFT